MRSSRRSVRATSSRPWISVSRVYVVELDRDAQPVGCVISCASRSTVSSLRSASAALSRRGRASGSSSGASPVLTAFERKMSLKLGARIARKP